MINHELWRIVASGGLTLLLNEMMSIADIDTRARLNERRDFLAWLRVELAASGSLAFAVSEKTLGLLWDEVQASAYYAPELREQTIPLVEGATTSGGNTLEAGAAPEDHTTMVYSFDGLTFTEVGDLAGHDIPGKGDYVLANIISGNSAQFSLPSLFLALAS